MSGIVRAGSHAETGNLLSGATPRPPVSRVPDDEAAIDVMVVEDFQLLRSAMVALLGQYREIRVVGATNRTDEALERASELRPAVTLVGGDNGMESALELAEKLAHVPGSRSLLLSGGFGQAFVRRAFAGKVSGLVHRDAPARQLMEAIHQVHRGQRVFDPDLMATVMSNQDCPLRPREVTVLEGAARGETVAEIAARCHLSVGTVRNYLASAVARLDARNRIDAVRVAREAGWI